MENKNIIKLRFDVDYSFSSRTKSLINMLNFNPESSGYLKNAITIAEMINQSNVPVVAYWFFTPYTLPNKELQSLLDNNKHNIGLHIINKPFEELTLLEKWVNKPIKYYTLHGTSSQFSQLIWGRKLGQTQIEIPDNFPLESLHKKLTYSIDKASYNCDIYKAIKLANEEISVNHILSMHPEWLCESNGKDRGPFYYTLRSILLGY